VSPREYNFRSNNRNIFHTVAGGGGEVIGVEGPDFAGILEDWKKFPKLNMIFPGL
jgi:hypothetical protein